MPRRASNAETAAADAIRGTIRRKRSTIDDALDALDDDGRTLWTRYLDDEVAAVAAGIRGAEHLARALSVVSGAKVPASAVRRWRDDRPDT